MPVQDVSELIIVDVHSTWIKAVCTPSATSAAVIQKLNVLFAQIGLPDINVTNNGTYFVSTEFVAILYHTGM